MKFWRATLSLLALAALSACAVQPLPAGTADRFHRVGIVSAIGDEAHFVRIGGTVFEYQEKYVPIADWKLDERAIEKVRVELAQRRPGVTLVTFNGKPPEIMYRAYRQLGSPGIETVVQDLRPWAEAERLDAILVFTKNGLQARGVDNFKAKAWGIGFYGTSLFGGRLRYTSTVGLYLHVIDPKEMKPLGQQFVWASKYPEGAVPATAGYAEVFLDNADGARLEKVRDEDILLMEAEISGALTRLGF